VQKITGEIIILMRLTKPVPSGAMALPALGNSPPSTAPATTATSTAMYSQWVRSGLAGGGVAPRPSSPAAFS